RLILAASLAPGAVVTEIARRGVSAFLLPGRFIRSVRSRPGSGYWSQPFPQGSRERCEPRVLCSRDWQDATIFGDVVRRYVGQVDPDLFLGNLADPAYFLQDPRKHPALLPLAPTI